MHKITFTILLFSLCLSLHAQLLSPQELSQMPEYTSLDEALKNPESVYRLKLKGQKKWDSIPEKLFKLKNLQELTIIRSGVMKVNRNISQLQNLQYLDISRNRLVSLPNELTQLSELKTLIINRNMIETLPDSIGNLKKLEKIDAWDNRLYVFPKSISKLAETLKEVDLRQIPLREEELVDMEHLLPKTKIFYTSLCECSNGR